MQHLLHLTRVDEAIGLAVVALQEAVAVRMALHAAADEIEVVDQAQCAAPVLHHAALVLQLFQRLLKVGVRRTAEAEAACGLARLQRHTGRAQLGEQRLGGARAAP